jgi:hypothetical protein
MKILYVCLMMIILTGCGTPIRYVYYVEPTTEMKEAFDNIDHTHTYDIDESDLLTPQGQ